MDYEGKIKLLKLPVIGWFIQFLFRAKIALGSLFGPIINVFKWLFSSREITNFTYDITDRNQQYLASMVALVSGKPREEIIGYIEELRDDELLVQHVFTKSKSTELSFISDTDARYGRRMGWYALTRALKPKVVVETGVDKGLGACVLSAAMLRNKEEGYEGKYYGTDINPAAGHLFSGDYAGVGKIIYGDSIRSLSAFEDKIDIFISDSDHSLDYEACEYETIDSKLSENGVVLSDNSHVSSKLLEYSIKKNRSFLFFKEEPENHWYPGAGIGFSFRGKVDGPLN